MKLMSLLIIMLFFLPFYKPSLQLKMASFVKCVQPQVVFFSDKPVSKEWANPNLLCLEDGLGLPKEMGRRLNTKVQKYVRKLSSFQTNWSPKNERTIHFMFGVRHPAIQTVLPRMRGLNTFSCIL
jgi:hypothetical protein